MWRGVTQLDHPIEVSSQLLSAGTSDTFDLLEIRNAGVQHPLEASEVAHQALAYRIGESGNPGQRPDATRLHPLFDLGKAQSVGELREIVELVGRDFAQPIEY